MKKFYLILVFIFCGIAMMAQETEKKPFFLFRGYYNHNYDTAYIGRPVGTKWTFKLRTMLIWQKFEAFGNVYDVDLGSTTFESRLRTQMKPKLNIQVGYMGVALAGGISFNKLAGQKDTDFDIKLNMYGKKFGFELGLSGIQSLHGNYILDIPNIAALQVIVDDNDTINIDLPIEFEVPEGKVSQAVINFNFYYAFNHKKFSYPAAFTQMFIQKRSAGSFLAGAELHANDIAIGDTLTQDELFHLRNVTYGIGVGYGYNLVLPHSWLIHVSALPYIVLHSKTRVRNYMEKEINIISDFPEVFIIGRAAIVHDFNTRWFIGATGQMNWSNVNTKTLKTGNSQFQVFAFVGIRL